METSHTTAGSQRTPSRRSTPGARLLTSLWIGCVFGVTIALPCGLVCGQIGTGVADEGLSAAAIDLEGVRALARSLAYAGVIGLVSVLLAMPVALLAAGWRPHRLVMLAVPMLLPPYLAYAGWSIARAPTTALGRWIAAAPERGQDWLPLMASRTLAVWGLGLWAFPLAALVLVASLRAVASQVDGPLALDCPHAWQRWRARAHAVWPGLAAGWALVTLLMLGSAVPLHVARVQTYAIRVWATLDDAPGEPWRAWLAAWPLALIASAAGWMLSGRVLKACRDLSALADTPARVRRRRALVSVLASLPWLLAVAVPFGLFSSSMGSHRMLGVFLDRAGEGVATSLAVGAVVGCITMLTCVAVAHAADARSPRGLALHRVILAACLAWTLMPGVLAGSAVAGVVRLPLVPDGVADSALPMVVAHVSRCLFLPVLVGLWLASAEAASIGDARRLDGATGPLAWGRTVLGTVPGPALAVGVSCMCLSVHEIESSLQVQAPGIDHLAQRLLQWLHYERTAELSAAGVLLLGLGMIAGLAGMMPLWWPRKRTPPGSQR